LSICTYCAKDKPEDRYKQCPSCREKRRAYMRQYYADNKRVLCERVKEYRTKNSDMINEKKRRYYEQNKETVLARNTEWRNNNQAKVKAQRDKWRNENRERHRENSRQWIADNPERYREIQRHAQIRRRFIKAGLEDHYTKEEWQRLLHKYDCRCVKCGGAENIEVDHVVPLSGGGTNTIDNIQPLCRSCNAQKWVYDYDYR